jgi:hypothetical protein
VFASGEGEEVVRAEHIGQTAVVCDQSRDDAKVTSELDNVDFLVKETCVIIIEWVTSTKNTRNMHQWPKSRTLF